MHTTAPKIHTKISYTMVIHIDKGKHSRMQSKANAISWKWSSRARESLLWSFDHIQSEPDHSKLVQTLSKSSKGDDGVWRYPSSEFSPLAWPKQTSKSYSWITMALDNHALYTGACPPLPGRRWRQTPTSHLFWHSFSISSLAHLVILGIGDTFNPIVSLPFICSFILSWALFVPYPQQKKTAALYGVENRLFTWCFSHYVWFVVWILYYKYAHFVCF